MLIQEMIAYECNAQPRVNPKERNYFHDPQNKGNRPSTANTRELDGRSDVKYLPKNYLTNSLIICSVALGLFMTEAKFCLKLMAPECQQRPHQANARCTFYQQMHDVRAGKPITGNVMVYSRLIKTHQRLYHEFMIGSLVKSDSRKLMRFYFT